MLLSTVLLTGCSSNLPRVLNPGSGTQAIELTPAPVELTGDTPSSTFTVQNDVAGISYTPSADPNCQNASGGIFVAGDGQAQVDVVGSPVMFVVYAIGTPPATCTVTVRSSDGQSVTVDVTYQVYVVQAVPNKHESVTMAVSPGLTASATTITKLAQIVSIVASGFSGTITPSVSGTGCTGSSGLEVNPKQLSNGAGTFTALAYGQGNISASCTVKVTDSANNSATVPITIAIGALSKFTVTLPTAKVQFGCAGSTLPKHCQTIQTVTLQETGATGFAIADKPALIHTCANAFNGPLKMVSAGGTPASSVAGPTASVAFDGLLPTATLGCSRIVITDGRTPEQTVNVPVDGTLATAPPPAISAAVAPSCKGNDPMVAAPSAPHGLFVWNPTGFPKYQTYLTNDVIGKDPNFCGVSLVVKWADVQTSKTVYAWWNIATEVKQYTDAGLTVNLLFADSTEGSTNDVTPAWVMAPKSQGGDGVPSITCAGQPQIPVYINAQYEADWEAFIAAAIQQFSFNGSALAPSVGYMRFATAGGAEALAPPNYNDNGACQAQWVAVGLTYASWKQHEINIINAMGQQMTDKQIVVSLPGPITLSEPADASVYDMSNAAAAVAAAQHVGFSFENLGSKPVSPPAPCNPAAKVIDLHWCQAYQKYRGVVPLNTQPITATSSNTVATWDIADLLQYGLDNNIQVFELYPDDWIQADSPEAPENIGQTAHYKAAMTAASLVLGVSH